MSTRTVNPVFTARGRHPIFEPKALSGWHSHGQVPGNRFPSHSCFGIASGVTPILFPPLNLWCSD